MKQSESPTKNDNHVRTLDMNDVIGDFGKWQAFILFVTLISQFIGTGHLLGTVYMAPDIDYWCSKSEVVEDVVELAHERSTIVPTMNLSSSMDESTRFRIKNQCWKRQIHTNHSSNCTHWEFDHSVFSSTITEEFGLICSKSWYISLSRTILMAGYMTACLAFGAIADWFGRKPVILCSNLIFLVSTFVCTYSGNFWVFSVSQFFVGFGKTGLTNALYILLIESTGTKWRSIIAMVDGFGFSLGFLILPGVAYWLRGWRELQLAYSIPVALLFILSWFLPESPRWLLSVGSSKAETVLKEAIKVNCKKKLGLDETTSNISIIIKQSNLGATKDKYNIYHLLKTPNMRKKTLVMFFTWSVVTFVYYGLSLNANDGLGKGHHPFIMMAILGIVLFPSRTLVHFSITYLGRRLSLMVTLLGVGLSCLIIIPLTTVSFESNLIWVKIVFATLGMCFVSSAMSVMYVHTSELFPTKVRSLGFTSCSFFARVGSMISPFMKELGEGNDFMIPMLVFGGLAMINAIMVLVLPETKGSSLPETLKEGEEFGIKSKKSEIPKSNSIFYIVHSENVLEDSFTRF